MDVNNLNKTNDTVEAVNPLSKIKVNRIILPILLGLGYVFWKMYQQYDAQALAVLKLTWISAAFILLAFVMMVFRDLGYVIRLRILSDNDLTWRKALRIVMLWEFTSAITPSAVGGTSVAILYVNKEGLSVGRSSAIVMATSFLDELYFILLFPILLLLINPVAIFVTGTSAMTFPNTFFWLVLIGYFVKLAYTLVLSYGLFINPRGLKWLILIIFKLPFLRKWRYGAHLAGTDIIDNSKLLRRKNLKFWLQAFGSTAFSWTSRYWVVNAILLAFFMVPEQLLLFARQLVMWIMMLISPTPGGSGFSEYIFIEFLSDFMPVSPVEIGTVAVALALLWRLITYYPYLIIGAFILPLWLKKHFIKVK